MAVVCLVGAVAVGLILAYTEGLKATESPPPGTREQVQTAVPIQRIECDKITPAGCLRWTVYRITEQ